MHLFAKIASTSMPHTRARWSINQLIKRLKFSPVVAIQGARQTGKSFLIQEILKRNISNLTYKSLDDPNLRLYAKNNPLSFLKDVEEKYTLAIDEAQKVPELFDCVKLIVDEKRRPGSFILLGSTEFSHLFKVRESLTGRVTLLKLFPLLLRESLSLKFRESSDFLIERSKDSASRKQLDRYLHGGGFPGIFSIRDRQIHQESLQSWLELTCFRDLTSIPKGKFDGQLGLEIVQAVATLENPGLAEISHKVRKDSRVVAKHLDGLKSLFVVNELMPHPLGVGKKLYFICDVGLANFLGANRSKLLWTWHLIEALGCRSYSASSPNQFFYYRAKGGSLVHLVEGSVSRIIAGCKIQENELADEYELRGLRAFLEKNNAKCSLLLSYGGYSSFKNDGINITPWEMLAT